MHMTPNVFDLGKLDLLHMMLQSKYALATASVCTHTRCCECIRYAAAS